MSESFQNCPKCGRLISATATTCQHCGATIEAPVYDNFDNNNSGQGPQSEVADIVAKRFNWGAFCFNWIWCIVYKQYLWAVVVLVCSFIPLVSFINLGFIIYFGIKGNTWAWQAKHYKSVEEFHKIHKIWACWGLVPLLFFVFGVVAAMTIPTLMNSTTAQQYKVGMKKSVFVLSQSSQLLTAQEAKITDLSASGLTDYFQNAINGEKISSDKIKTTDGMVYTFIGNGDCTSEGCYVTVDTNGEEKGPNMEWTDVNKPCDIISVPIRYEDGFITVYGPEILTQLSK